MPAILGQGGRKVKSLPGLVVLLKAAA